MNNRGRNFAGVFYPESCPFDYLERIEKFGCKCALSPLHTPDAEEKKPHYHILFQFSGNKSIEQVRFFMNSLGSSMVQVVNDFGAMVRYLVHRDNPEKQQFDESEIICYHNIEVSKYFKTNADKIGHMRKVIEIIQKEHIRSYNELLLKCSESDDLMTACLKYAYALNLFLKGV